jgi:hypothetical protein
MPELLALKQVDDRRVCAAKTPWALIRPVPGVTAAVCLA